MKGIEGAKDPSTYRGAFPDDEEDAGLFFPGASVSNENVERIRVRAVRVAKCPT